MTSLLIAGISISFVILLQANLFFADDFNLKFENFEKTTCFGNSTGHKIFFYLYTNKNKTHYENVTLPEDLKNSSLNSDLKTIFLIHGWKNDIKSPMIQLIKDGYLNLSDYNIIGVDWGFGADNPYPTSASCVSLVASWIGTYIKYLIDPKTGMNVTLDKINLVGHSLGAHIAGIVGEYFRIVEDCMTIPVIVGLDPAGPSFIMQNMFSRLDLHDAFYVEVIHTSNTYFGLYSLLGWLGFRTLGMPEAIGDVDIYPNYGGNQPMCTNGFTRFFGVCAHSQAYVDFAYSLTASKNHSKVAIECQGGLNDILKERCSSNNNSFYYMGDPEDRKNLSKSRQEDSLGIYYFKNKCMRGSTWDNFQYGGLMFVAYLIPILLIAVIIVIIYYIIKLSFRLAGYECVKIVKNDDENQPILNEDEDQESQTEENVVPSTVDPLLVN